jgi:hypothetical protein
MEPCPNCAAPLDGLVPFCWHCGRDVKDPLTPETPEGTASDPLPASAGVAPPVRQATERSSDAKAPRADAAIAASSERRRLPGWALAVAGVLAVLAAVLAVGRAGIGKPEPPRPSLAASSTAPSAAASSTTPSAAASSTAPSAAASNAVPVPLPVDPESIIDPSSPPTWVGARRATWARDGSKTIAFELAASNDVEVWMKRVQPLLVVRCLSRTTEVFVATGSAASIEQEAGTHTVRIQLDDAEPVAQPWSDSVNSQELFAPDGEALVRRLAQARTMRFGFTPYNSAPVVAAFDVTGFDKIVGLVAGACGWRVDDARPAERRRAALN